MKFGSAKTAIHYFFNHQLMTPENDIEKLWVRVQHTVKGGAGAMWLSLELGDMVRPINTLGRLPLAWAMFAYAGEGWYSDLQYVQLKAHIIYRCRQSLGIEKPNKDMCAKLSKMADLALHDYALRDTTGRPKFTDVQLCGAIGVQQSNWKKCWEEKYLAMQKPLNTLAAKSLAPVRKRLDELAEAEAMEREKALAPV